MKIALIAAMANNRVIGKDNKMPWHLPADLAHFKMITLNLPILMGRKTFESIGRPLPLRRNLVVTSKKNISADVEIFDWLDNALDAVKNEAKVMIIGGQTVFEQMLPLAEILYLTFIDLDTPGDTYFPAWDESVWHEVAREAHKSDIKNSYDYQFVEYRRVV